MPLGAVGSDYVNLNVDSLWSGGPFENSVGLINYPLWRRDSNFLMASRAIQEETQQALLCP
jgi:hypothetical protein